MLNKKITRRRNDKKIAKLISCKLRGHLTNLEGRCIQCFLEYWTSCPVSMSHKTCVESFDAMVEAVK